MVPRFVFDVTVGCWLACWVIDMRRRHVAEVEQLTEVEQRPCRLTHRWRRCRPRWPSSAADAKNVLFWDPLGWTPRLTAPLAVSGGALEVIW